MAIPEWDDFPKMWEQAVIAAGGNPDAYPFWLVSSNSMQFAFGAQASIQLMHELAKNVAGYGGLVMNASRAREIGIEEGDKIEISTQGLELGGMQFCVKASGRIRYWRLENLGTGLLPMRRSMRQHA